MVEATPGGGMYLSLPDNNLSSGNLSGEQSQTSRAAHIEEMNLIYRQEELEEALKTTNELIEGVRERKDCLYRELAIEMCNVNVSVDQVVYDQQQLVRDSFTCGLCFEVLRDPVVCANESCQYMMCKEHVRPDMLCPNRCCADKPLETVKVQRVILNQLMNVEIKCHLCDMTHALGERENHFFKYCPNMMVEHCIFPDCKTYEPQKRVDFESHLVTTCGSKMKQC